MAEDLNREEPGRDENELLPAAAEPVGAIAGEPQQATEQPDADDDAPPYQSRFQLVLGVLLGIGMAAVAATAIFLATDREEPRPFKWSGWEPAAKTGEQALDQIAEHVGLKYYLPSGRQLVAVRGGPLSIQGVPLTVAVTGDDGSIKQYDEGALFQLCGLGKNCAINEGKPSTRRLLVLGRESLELALYTFRYIDNLDVVVAMLPPAPGDTPSRAMFFRRQDLEQKLRDPLHVTLPGPTPAINKVRGAKRAELEHLTGPNIYNYKIEPGLDVRLIMSLERPD